MYKISGCTHRDVTHWFVDYGFKALSLAFWLSPSCFLEPQVTIFGREGGVEEEELAGSTGSRLHVSLGNTEILRNRNHNLTWYLFLQPCALVCPAVVMQDELWPLVPAEMETERNRCVQTAAALPSARMPRVSLPLDRGTNIAARLVSIPLLLFCFPLYFVVLMFSNECHTQCTQIVVLLAFWKLNAISIQQFQTCSYSYSIQKCWLGPDYVTRSVTLLFAPLLSDVALPRSNESTQFDL